MAEKEELTERKLSQGSYFGEISFFLECRVSATITAEDNAQTYSLPRKKFERVIKDNSALFGDIRSQMLNYNDPKTSALQELLKAGLPFSHKI